MGYMHAIGNMDLRTEAEKLAEWRDYERAKFVCETAGRALGEGTAEDLIDAAEALAAMAERKGVAFWMQRGSA
jgi:hypothetical protein